MNRFFKCQEQSTTTNEGNFSLLPQKSKTIMWVYEIKFCLLCFMYYEIINEIIKFCLLCFMYYVYYFVYGT